MNVVAEIPQSEIDRLKLVLDKIGGELKKSSADILRQAMIFAIQSAAKATAPGKTQLPSKLPDKYKYRPIERYRGNPILYINESNGYVFQSEATPRRKNVHRITRAWKYWDKSKGQFSAKPYTGTATKKYDKDKKFGRIPYAGAAKAGWLKALNRLPKAPGYSDGEAQTGKALPIVTESKGNGQHGISVENIIKYIGKTSPNAAAQGLHSATSRMIGSYKKKIADLEKYKA